MDQIVEGLVEKDRSVSISIPDHKLDPIIENINEVDTLDFEDKKNILQDNGIEKVNHKYEENQEVGRLCKQILNLSEKIVETNDSNRRLMDENKKLNDFNNILLQDNEHLKDQVNKLKEKYDELNRTLLTRVSSDLEQCRLDIRDLTQKYDLLKLEHDANKEIVFVCTKTMDRSDQK